MNEQLIARALDNAIAKVVSGEIKKLLNGMEPEQRVKAVCDALRELDYLVLGYHPNYSNDMTALLYVSWYQPKQINLICSVIKLTINLKKDSNFILDSSGKLNVSGFNCGALAIQFAVALAVANAMQRNEFIPILNVSSYGTSKPIIELGKKIWQCLQIEMNRKPITETETLCGFLTPVLIGNFVLLYVKFISNNKEGKACQPHTLLSSLFGADGYHAVMACTKPVGIYPDHISETAVAYISDREALTKAMGFMDAYDFTLNLYSGCSFGCTYCYAAFFSRDIEKRDSWGKWVSVKDNAVELLKKRKPGTLDGKLIYMRSVTDPYQSSFVPRRILGALSHGVWRATRFAAAVGRRQDGIRASLLSLLSTPNCAACNGIVINLN